MNVKSSYPISLFVQGLTSLAGPLLASLLGNKSSYPISLFVQGLTSLAGPLARSLRSKAGTSITITSNSDFM